MSAERRPTQRENELSTVAALVEQSIRHDNFLLDAENDRLAEHVEHLEHESLSLWNALNDESRHVMQLEEELDMARAIIADLRQQIYQLTHPNHHANPPLVPSFDLGLLFSDSSDTETDPEVIDLVSP